MSSDAAIGVDGTPSPSARVLQLWPAGLAADAKTPLREMVVQVSVPWH